MTRLRTAPEQLGLSVEVKFDPAALGHAVAGFSPAHLAQFLTAFCADVTSQSLSAAAARSLTSHVERTSHVSRILNALQEVA